MKALLAVVAIMATLLLGVPVLAVVARAALDGTLLASLAEPAVGDALRLSLLSTSISLVLIVTLGTPLALAVGRRHGRRMAAIETLIDLPIVLPPSVAGLALLLVVGRGGPLGAVLDDIGLSISFSLAAVVLAQVFVAMPFFVRAVRTAVASIPRELEEAARIDGADDVAVMRHVTLPLAAPAMASGAVVAWARALGEFGATIMVAGSIAGATRTLPLFVYSAFQTSLDDAIAAAAVLVVAAVAVLLTARLLRVPLDPDLATR